MDPGEDGPTPETIAGRPTVKSLGGVVMSGTLWLTGSRMVRIITTILTLAILARLITPAEFGVVAAASLAETFVLMIMHYGLGVPLLRPKELPREAIQTQLWASLLIALALAAVTVAIAPAAERALRFPGLAAALVAFTPVYFAHAVITASTSLMQRQFRFRAAAVATLACRLFGYSLPAVVMALAGWGMWAIIWAQVGSLVLTAIVLGRMSRLPLRWPGRFRFGRLGSDGVGGGLYGVIASLQANIDTAAVAVALGPAVTGLYSRAYNITVHAKDPFVSLQLTVRQALASMQDEPARAEEGLIRVLRLAAIGSFIIAAFGFSAAGPLTGVLLGPQWLAAAPMLALLFLGFPARVLLLMLDAVSMALGRVWPMVLRQLGLLVLIGVVAFAVADQGAVWVGGMVSAAFWLGVLVTAFMVAAGAGISPWRMLGALAPGLAIGLLLGAVLWVAGSAAPDNAFLQTGLAGAIAAIFCALVGLLLPQAWLGAYLGGLRRRALGVLRPAR